MGLRDILFATKLIFLRLSKVRLVDAILNLREKYFKIEAEIEALRARTSELEEENKRLKAEQAKQKVKEVNKTTNQPTSKQADWEQKGVGNDGLGKKKGRGRKGRPGAGNKSKDRPITHRETAKVERCNVCGKDLSQQSALISKNIRIVEEIPSLPIETEVIEITQEKKYCRHCSNVTTAKSERAIPGSDIGLNTSVQIIYFWIACMLPYSKIADTLRTIFGIKISTVGLSKHIIKIAKIMRPVYEEIHENVKAARLAFADETGWRVNGDLWWLWFFGNQSYAYYRIDKSRGGDVVKAILGEYFNGILVVDGWRAYCIIDCLQQSCMAHLLRKIRNLCKAFPNLRSVFEFYVIFRRILLDGECLQEKRKELGEKVFQRRLQKLHDRLDKLLLWKNPNEILKDIIGKVERQRPRILTFVEHEGVPCHNNFSEGKIRVAVTKRKISFGSKSEDGAEAYAILLSIHETCKLQKISFIAFLLCSLKHYIRTGRPVLLKEYTKRQTEFSIAA